MNEKEIIIFLFNSYLGSICIYMYILVYVNLFEILLNYLIFLIRLLVKFLSKGYFFCMRKLEYFIIFFFKEER